MDKEIKELQESYEKVIKKIQIDIDNYNNKKGDIKIIDIKNKISESDFHKKLIDYLEKRNLQPEPKGFGIETTHEHPVYGTSIDEIPIINEFENGKLVIVPFPRIWGALLITETPLS